MKRLTLGTLALALPFATTAAPETYTIDPIHSFPHFGIEHFGVSIMWGRFDKMAGKFMIDRAAKKASVELTIEAGSVTTGDSDKGSRPQSRDDHLKSADFFNVKEFPRMSYKSTNVNFSGDNPAEIEGQFTLLGVTKPVTLKIERWVCKDNPFNKKPMCGGNASGSFKRSDFGMKYAIQNNIVGDEVRLHVEFEGYKD